MNVNGRSWAGWFRESGRVPWRKIVEASTEGEAHVALHDALKVSGDYLLMPAGRDPNRERMLPRTAATSPRARHDNTLHRLP